MQSQFMVWGVQPVPHMCSLDKLIGVEKISDINNGVALRATFPANASFTMNPERPNDTLLTDNLFNLDGLIVASKRVKEQIEAAKSERIEFLPVAIRDHKEKIASRDYFIVHPVEPVDVLDLARSDAKMSKIIKTRVASIKRLVLDETKLDPSRALFRIRNYTSATMIRRDLADALLAKGFSGLRFVEPERFPED